MGKQDVGLCRGRGRTDAGAERRPLGEAAGASLHPRETKIDGVFGTETRAAVVAWQFSVGWPETGLFSNSDASALLAAVAASLPGPERSVAYVAKPLSQAGYHSPLTTLEHQGLKVTLITSASTDKQVCLASGNGLLPFGALDDGKAGRHVVTIRIEALGKPAFASPVASVGDEQDMDRLDLKAAIRALGPGADLPQVVLSGYSGGAHCCTGATVATAKPDGA